MTIRLYDQDARLLHFTATVRTCQQKDEHYLVTLDQTAFFPEGGGQGADHGTLAGVHVLDAHDVDGEVLHLTDGPLDFLYNRGTTIAAAQRRAYLFRAGAQALWL